MMWNSVLNNYIESSPCPSWYRYPTAARAGSETEIPTTLRHNLANSTWDNCADGYSDRNMLLKSLNNMGNNCAVNALSSDVGYIELLLYDSATLAPVFGYSEGNREADENVKMSFKVSGYVHLCRI